MKKCYEDLPENATEKVLRVAIDTETMGLNLQRDRLCVLQININYENGKEETYVVHFPKISSYKKAVNLKKLLKNNDIIKIFHYARFDILAISQYLKVFCKNIVCTKILSRITRTYTDKHSLVALVQNITDVNLSKQMQCSDWGQEQLTDQQYSYAENDVKYLFKIYDNLKAQAIRENKWKMCEKIFKILPTINYIESKMYDPIELLAFDLKSHKY